MSPSPYSAPRGPWRLSALLVGLLAIQSAAGLFVPGLYRDPPWALAAWRGNDLVTLFVAVPLLTIGLRAAARGSVRGALVWFGMLAYSLYNAGYYLFGARLNALLPVYVLLFVLPVFAAIGALGRWDPEPALGDAARRAPNGWVVAYMAFTGGFLAVGWLGQWAGLVFGGMRPPAMGEEALSLILAMDLSFLVPGFLAGAALLRARRPWGYVLASVMNLKGATYTLVLAVGSAVAAARGIEGQAAQIPIWAAWTLAGAAAAAHLLRGAPGRR